MGAGGAVVAIIAAQQRRIQETVDAFRIGDATAPDRARRLEDLGIIAGDETHNLVVQGVLVPGPREGTYYLSEAAYIYSRDNRKGITVIAAVVAGILMIGLLVLVYSVGRT